MPPFTTSSGTSIAINVSGSLNMVSDSTELMRTKQKFVYNHPENRVQFKTYLESNALDISTVVTESVPYERMAERGLGTISVNNGALYEADLFFVEKNGDRILKIDIKTWNNQFRPASTAGSFNNYSYTASSSINVNITPVQIYLSSTNDIPAQEFLNLIFGKHDLKTFCHMLKELATDNGIHIPNEIEGWDVVDDPASYNRNIRIPLLSYLMYPMVREAKSVSVAMNSRSFESVWYKYGSIKYKDLVQKAFKVSTPKLLKELWDSILSGKEDDYFAVPAPAPQAFVAETLPDVNAITYGKYRGTKSFDASIFAMALNVFEAFGFDYLYQFLNEVKNPTQPSVPNIYLPQISFGECTTQVNDLKTLSKYFDKGKIVRMYAKGSDQVRDTVNMLNELTQKDFIPLTLIEIMGNQYSVPKCKDLTELHDKLSRDLTTIKAEKKKRPINLYPWEEMLDGAVMDNLHFHVARNTSQLAAWGAALKNCIASYDQKAVEKKCTLVGIHDLSTGELLYTMELKPLAERNFDCVPSAYLSWSNEEQGKYKRENDKFKANFIFWENPKQMPTDQYYSLGDQAGIVQLVKLQNGRLDSEQFQKVSQVVYKWYNDSKDHVVKWLELQG